MENSIRIMGVRIDKITLQSAADKVCSFLKGEDTKVVYTPNTEMVMAAKKDNDLRNIINSGDLVIPDGIGLIYASRIKKKGLPERVTGYDLSVKMLEIANNEEYSVFLLGGEPGVAEEASERIKDKYSQLKIAGYHHGFFKGAHVGYDSHDEEERVIEEINSSGTDILFVGFGAARQEKWIHKNKGKLKCKVVIGNGGTIDVLAGKVKRAPLVYQKLGLEWLYRLIKEPWRIKRQLVLPLFVLEVLLSKENIVE